MRILKNAIPVLHFMLIRIAVLHLSVDRALTNASLTSTNRRYDILRKNMEVMLPGHAHDNNESELGFTERYGIIRKKMNNSKNRAVKRNFDQQLFDAFSHDGSRQKRYMSRLQLMRQRRMHGRTNPNPVRHGNGNRINIMTKVPCKKRPRPHRNWAWIDRIATGCR